MSRIEVNIAPGVLQWAREEAGYDLADIALKMKIPTDRYKSWERNGEKVPLGKLKEIANHYKRQLAVFFLPRVPEKLVRPKDFRNIAVTKSKLSPKVLLVMRDVMYYRQTALEINGEAYWKNRYDWLKDIVSKNVNADLITSRLRERLNIPIDEQLHWKSVNEAYRIWRNAVENQLGILVFQFPMPLKEVQGFSFTDSFPYAIIVNSNHSYTGRIFTIFHELAHIIKLASGICLWDNVTEKQNEEWECNSFAGNFLVPKNALQVTDDLKEIRSYANQFKISPEAYLRRLKEEEKIPAAKFFALLGQIKESYREPAKKKDIIIKPEVKSRASRGETFYNLVLDALNQNRISYTQASGMLDLNINRVLREA
jgi:Zn-dependent peptidase ImmA (M78 family)/transcriptional regulator with XRE-family HTH domain